MIKWQDLVLNSPAGITSIHAWFVSKHFTYLLQAVPQRKLRSNLRALLCIMTKRTRTVFGSISWQRNTAKTGFYLLKTKRAPGRDWQGNAQSRSKAASCPQHRYKSNAEAAWHSWCCPLPATRTTTAFPGDHCPTHRWSHLVPVSLEQVPSGGKHLGLHIPPPLLNFSRNMLWRSAADAGTPISSSWHPVPRSVWRPAAPSRHPWIQ